MTESNDWEPAVLDDIWWEIHGKAMSSFHIGNRTTLQKFIHKRWACNEKENRYFEYKPDMCKKCSDTTETQLHVLQCNNCDKRADARKQFIINLRKIMANTKTNSDLSRVLVHNIDAWLHMRDPEPLHNLVDNPSSQFVATVQAQCAIGWHQIFKGRMSEQWGALYNYDIINKHPETTHKLTAERWGKKIIVLAMQYALDAWQIRNDIEHDTEGDPNKTKKIKLIEKIVWSIDQIGNAVKHPYAELEYDELIEMPTQNLQMMAEYLNVKKWKWQIKEYKLLKDHESPGESSDSEEESVFDTESGSDESDNTEMTSE
jgi:hypothetical protein